MKVLKLLRLIAHYLRHNAMSAMAYRGAFLMQALGMLLNDVMLLFFWTVLFSRFPTVKGWALNDVIALYAIMATGFGMATIICGNSWNVARIIANGDLDYYLALPADPLVHLLISRMSLPAWGDAAFGILVYLIATPERWATLPLFLFLCALSGIIFIAFGALVGSLAFWLGQAQNLTFQMNNALLSFGLYPIDIFPGGVRLLLYTLIPAAFVGSVPATLLRDFNVTQLAILVGFVLGIWLVARWVFHRGLRRYVSGNLITMRG
ncbi:MAG: ABC-2 family transporter protein [Anaerolineae bacterium]|nr:ABC-2 family transporter protein [Anaerolineae bacterium]